MSEYIRTGKFDTKNVRINTREYIRIFEYIRHTLLHHHHYHNHHHQDRYHHDHQHNPEAWRGKRKTF